MFTASSFYSMVVTNLLDFYVEKLVFMNKFIFKSVVCLFMTYVIQKYMKTEVKLGAYEKKILKKNRRFVSRDVRLEQCYYFCEDYVRLKT